MIQSMSIAMIANDEEVPNSKPPIDFSTQELSFREEQEYGKERNAPQRYPKANQGKYDCTSGNVDA